MARDLGDVIHYFIPEATPSAAPTPSEPAPASTPAEESPSTGPAEPAADALPARSIVALPIEHADVLRAAFVWNLAVEIARSGASATVVAPRGAETVSSWSTPGRGPIGAELLLVDATSLADLQRAASEAAAASSHKPGLVLVCAPTDWWLAEDAPPELLRWLLLLCSPGREEIEAAHDTARQWSLRAPEARLGVTIHGVRRVAEARAAFEALAAASESDLATPWTSYGLLVDDLHVYRAIVAQRPIGLAHPQSPAARALRDVARLLLEDLRDA